jgi:C_GCAxxG_C_C family probable redox protein
MSKHTEKAEALRFEGYNCCQAVFAAFSDEIGIDEKTALKLTLPFGGGIVSARETCGAFIGMLMVLGMKYGFSKVDPDARAEHYKMLDMAKMKFVMRAKSDNCGKLLEIDSSREGCNKLVNIAVEIIEKIGESK